MIFRRLARAEFDDAADWYERKRAGLGAAFTAAVRAALTAIEATPDAYPEIYEDVRSAPVAGYPYAIYYRVEPTHLSILAVYHTSRDPSGWQSRA